MVRSMRIGTKRYVVDVAFSKARRIDRAAARAGMTRSEFLRMAADDLLPRLERSVFADPNPKRRRNPVRFETEAIDNGDQEADE